MAFELTPAVAGSQAFALEAPEAASEAFAIEPTTPPAEPPPNAFGGFLQWRVNGVDLGDNQVGVIDFICPAGRW